jgi:hypothetical protein
MPADSARAARSASPWAAHKCGELPVNFFNSLGFSRPKFSCGLEQVVVSRSSARLRVSAEKQFVSMNSAAQIQNRLAGNQAQSMRRLDRWIP